METEPCLPFEDISLEGLYKPLKRRRRIQYTCFTVSGQFIMIGTNTGGVYVFHRKSRQFISILPGQAGAVTCLAVDGGEQLVAAGSLQGTVSVFSCPTARNWSGQLAALARLDAEVQAICWRYSHWSSQLVYVGTSAGKVLAVSVTNKKIPLASASISPMLQLDSSICELALCGQTLLVSTVAFCYLCNLQMEVFAQIGTQPRSRRLGACFVDEAVFCARPGFRLWEVCLSGQIVKTHQLRPALEDATPRRVVSACDQPACLQDGGSGGGKSSLDLVKLVPFSGGTVASFSGDAVFVLRLAARRVVLWTSVHGKVRDLAVLGDELYVQCDGGALRRLLVRQPSQIVRELRASRGAGQCARFLMSHGELTDHCRTRLPLQVLMDALVEFAGDTVMQAELMRLAVILRDRLAEDGVDVVDERLASPHVAETIAEEQPHFGELKNDGGSVHSAKPIKNIDLRFEGEQGQRIQSSENRYGQGSVNAAPENVAALKKVPSASKKKHMRVESFENQVVTDDQPFADLKSDSSSEICSASSSKDCGVPSPEESAPFQLPSLLTRLPRSLSSSGGATVFQSSLKRRPRARSHGAEPRVGQAHEYKPPDRWTAVTHTSERSAQSPPHLPRSPLQPSLTTFEKHNVSGGYLHIRSSPTASQMGSHSYMPGLTLQPEVLDAFSDLVEDVRGVVSAGFQRLVHRFVLHPSSPIVDSAVPVAAGKVDEPDQGRRTTEDWPRPGTTSCAAPITLGGGSERWQGCTSGTVEPDLSELTAAADSAELRLLPVLRWLEALAAMHCRLQPIGAEATGTEPKTAPGVEPNIGAFPVLSRLCSEPQRLVCERSFPVPCAWREQLSGLLVRAILFLVCDGKVYGELSNCALSAAPAEIATLMCRRDLDMGDHCNSSGDSTKDEPTKVAEIATPVEKERTTVSGRSRVSSGHEFVAAFRVVSELWEGAEKSIMNEDGLMHTSGQMGELGQVPNARDRTTEQSTRVESKPVGNIKYETSTINVEEIQPCEAAVVNSDVTIKHTDVIPTAALGNHAMHTDPEELRGSARAPPPIAGSSIWLTELLTRRLFYQLQAAELRTLLTRLPVGPRGHLWWLLLRETETHIGSLFVEQRNVATELELAACAELDWLTLARLATGLCRADPEAAATLCLRRSGRLTPLDALYVCRHAAASGSCTAAFAAYLSAAGSEATAPLLADAELATAATLSAVCLPRAAQRWCRCGWPRAGAHRVPRPAPTLLRRLLAARFSDDRLSCQLYAFGDFGGWLETGAASAVTDRCEPDWECQLAAMVCQLDDSTLLPTVASLLADWRPLLVATATVGPGRCCGCSGLLRSAAARQPLTIQMLLAFVCSAKGLEAARQLLHTASDVTPERLTASCYRDIILSTMLGRRAAALGAVFGVQVLSLDLVPVPHEALELLLSELGQWAPAALPTIGCSGAAVSPLTTDCPACCLPLRNRHLLWPHGLLVYRCRHAFHAVCVMRRGAGCMLCGR